MTAEEFKQEADALLPDLTHLAQGYLHNKEDAEDIAQDVLLKLWAMLHELRRPMAPLARILTHNLSIDHQRRQRHLLEFDSTQATTDKLSKISDNAASANPQDEMIERMMHIIEQLPPQQQLVLRLRHINKMSFSEIAQLTGFTEANVRQILCRARQGVRNQYIKTLNISITPIKKE